MKCILPPFEGMQKLLGAAVYDSGTSYIKTKYCIDAECDDGWLCLNILTGELLHFDEGEEWTQLQTQLVEKRFLVPQDFDEYAHAKQIKTVVGLLQCPASGITTYSILSTTDCNARCAYCFEHGITRERMSEQVAVDVARYIAKSSKGKSVSINWFGGEPLYNIEAIDIIVKELSRLGVVFKSHMTSNGFYLDSDVASRARDQWHLESAQITIDGTEDVYNHTKRYINAVGSSFQRVMSNIEHALDAGIRVCIRLNMDSGNVDDLYAVSDVIAERLVGKDGLEVQVAPLMALTGGVKEFGSEDAKIQSYVRLCEHLDELNLLRPAPLLRSLCVNCCKADLQSAEVILPNGRIAKCDHFDESENLGDIYSSWRNEVLISSWAEARDPEPQCKDCPRFPRCVLLKRCAWFSDGCSESARGMFLYKAKKQIVGEYKRYKEAM